MYLGVTCTVQNFFDEVLMFLRQQGVLMFQGQSLMDILTLENQHTVVLKDPFAQWDLEEGPFQTGLRKSAWGELYVHRDMWKFAV